MESPRDDRDWPRCNRQTDVLKVSDGSRDAVQVLRPLIGKYYETCKDRLTEVIQERRRNQKKVQRIH